MEPHFKRRPSHFAKLSQRVSCGFPEGTQTFPSHAKFDARERLKHEHSVNLYQESPAIRTQSGPTNGVAVSLKSRNERTEARRVFRFISLTGFLLCNCYAQGGPRLHITPWTLVRLADDIRKGPRSVRDHEALCGEDCSSRVELGVRMIRAS